MTETKGTPQTRQEFEKALDKSDTRVANFETKRTGLLERAQHFLHAYPTMVPVIVLIISLAIFGLVAKNFFSAFNLSLIIQQVSIIGMLAAAQSLVIITAGIDLSVAAIMVLCSVVAGKLAVEMGVPSVIALPVSFILGAACGWLNGFLITKVKLPPFITTLGTWIIFYALILYFSGAQSIRGADIDANAPFLKFFGHSIPIGGAQITYGSILMVLIFAVLWFMLNKTAWGRHVYAVGDDKNAAELAGIRTDKVLLSVYVLFMRRFWQD